MKGEVKAKLAHASRGSALFRYAFTQILYLCVYYLGSLPSMFWYLVALD
jgi:hypothetical protein